MEGKVFAQIINDQLEQRGIPKGEFYAAIGVTSAAMWGWRKNNATPKKETIAAAEKYLGISFADYEKSDIREELRDDLRILLHSARELPPSSVYALISQIEKLKEDRT